MRCRAPPESRWLPTGAAHPMSRFRHAPEYLDFLGSLFTTAMVNCAKWLQPAAGKERTTSSGFRGARLRAWRSRSLFAAPRSKPRECSGTAAHLEAACHSPPRTGTATGGCTHRNPEDTRGCTCETQEHAHGRPCGAPIKKRHACGATDAQDQRTKREQRPAAAAELLVRQPLRSEQGRGVTG